MDHNAEAGNSSSRMTISVGSLNPSRKHHLKQEVASLKQMIDEDIERCDLHETLLVQHSTNERQLHEMGQKVEGTTRKAEEAVRYRDQLMEQKLPLLFHKFSIEGQFSCVMLGFKGDTTDPKKFTEYINGRIVERERKKKVAEEELKLYDQA